MTTQVNGSAVAATTLAAAGKLFNATGGTSGSTSTKVGSATGTNYKQLWSRGTTTGQGNGITSIPAPTDAGWHGWMWDVTTLEGQRIAAGTWTPTIHLLASTSTTVTPTIQWFKRSSAGAYTSIGSVTGSSIALTTSSQLLVFTAPSLALMDFATGDKLVMWLWVNQTAGGATNSTISVVEAISGSTAGTTGEAQTVFPAYAPTPVALTVTMAGVGTLTAADPTYYAIRAQDTFVRVNQSGWGTASAGETWAFYGAASTNSIVSNHGQILSSGGADVNAQLGSNTAADQEIVCDITVNASSDIVGVEARYSGGSSPTNYKLLYYTNAIHINKAVAGVNTADLVASVSFTPTLGTAYTYKLEVIGTAIYGKVWQAGTTEPTAWTIGPATDSSVTSGGFAVLGNTSSASGVQFANFTADNTIIPLSGTLAGVGTLSGTLSTSSGGVALSVTMASVGTLTGTLSLATALSVTLAGVGTLTSTLSATTALTCTLAGVGTLTGTMAANTALSTTIAGIGTLSGTLSANTALSATISGVGTLSGTVNASTALACTLSGVGTLSGTLSTTGGGSAALSATMAGVGTLSGTMSLSTALTSQLSGVGQLAGTLSANTALARTIAGSGVLSGTLALSTSLSVLLSGTGTLAGVFSIRVALMLTCAGVGTLSGNLTIPVASYLSATWITRDLAVSWVTRDGKISWVTRDENAAWTARDEQDTWKTRDEQITWKARS